MLRLFCNIFKKSFEKYKLDYNNIMKDQILIALINEDKDLQLNESSIIVSRIQINSDDVKSSQIISDSLESTQISLDDIKSFQIALSNLFI